MCLEVSLTLSHMRAGQLAPRHLFGGADKGGAHGPGSQQISARRVPHLHLRPQARGMGHPGCLDCAEPALLRQCCLAHPGLALGISSSVSNCVSKEREVYTDWYVIHWTLRPAGPARHKGTKTERQECKDRYENLPIRGIVCKIVGCLPGSTQHAEPATSPCLASIRTDMVSWLLQLKTSNLAAMLNGSYGRECSLWHSLRCSPSGKGKVYTRESDSGLEDSAEILCMGRADSAAVRYLQGAGPGWQFWAAAGQHFHTAVWSHCRPQLPPAAPPLPEAGQCP